MLFGGYVRQIRPLWLPALVVVGLSGQRAEPAAESRRVCDISSRRQLFIDDYRRENGYVSELSGRIISVNVYMKGAELYALQFVN